MVSGCWVRSGVSLKIAEAIILPKQVELIKLNVEFDGVTIPR